MSEQIYGLMGQVMGEIKAISKSNTSGGLKYKFRGIDDIYLAVNPVLTKYGIFCMPERMENKRQIVTTKNGAQMTETLVTMKYTFYAPDGSSVYAIVDGEATDTSDKSCNQAMSAAHKYAILQAFFIPTDEPKDTENNHNELGVKPEETYGQALKRLKAEMCEHISDIEALDELHKIAKTFGKDRLSEVESIEQLKVLQAIEAKIKEIKGDK